MYSVDLHSARTCFTSVSNHKDLMPILYLPERCDRHAIYSRLSYSVGLNIPGASLSGPVWWLASWSLDQTHRQSHVNSLWLLAREISCEDPYAQAVCSWMSHPRGASDCLGTRRWGDDINRLLFRRMAWMRKNLASDLKPRVSSLANGTTISA